MSVSAFRPHRYWLFAALATATLTLLFLAYAWMDRQAELRMGESQARQISEYTSLLATGALQSSHQLVHAMELLARQAGRGRSADVANGLRRMRASNPHINDLLIIDRQGRVAYWTLEGTPPDISDRDYVVHHLRHKDTGLFVSPPQQARARPGKWFFALSDAMRDARGELEFILVVIIEAEPLQQLMAVDMAIPGSSQVLMTTDGRIYARRPDHDRNVGRQVTRPQVIDALGPSAPTLTTTIVSQLDNRERIASYRLLENLPMIAIGSIDVHHLLAPWRQRMLALAGLWVVLVAGILAGFATLVRKDGRMSASLTESVRFRKALDHVPAHVYLKDTESRYLYANRPTLDLFGCTAEQLVGAEDARFFPAETAARLRQIDLVVLSGRGSNEEIDVPDGGGGHRVYLEVKTPLRDLRDPSRIVGLCGISTDITGLKDQQAKLETMVEQRTADLRQATTRAEAANRAKTAFLANVGHELRTPMNGILGMVGLALRRESDPKIRHQLDVAQTSAERLLAVMNDILDFAKLEADQLSLASEAFEVGPLVDEICASFSVDAAEKDLALRVALAPELTGQALLGDPMRLRRVIRSLIDNAIKFSDAGEIRLAVTRIDAPDDTCRLRFELIDQGIGIDRADQARLFSAFEQADASMTRKYGGAGLGLAICKRLVAMMGGEIGVDSATGKGSSFWFTARFALAGARAE
jgi:PAS domain S-box-containing protein